MIERSLRVDLVVTSGKFVLDGDELDVDDNIWIIGDDEDVIVVDAAHETEPIIEKVGSRRATSIVCTHGHNDHINVALELASALGAPVGLHPDDRMLWDEVYPERAPDFELKEGEDVEVAGVSLEVIHTPGHTPGGVCLYDARGGSLFGGDTLFQGGPGATGRKFSDFDTIIASISRRLFSLPPATIVYPGHGDKTTIGDEAPHLAEWIARGY